MRELEQEVASAMMFINQAVGEDVSPYYWEIPASFMVPAVYYPSPEVETAGDSLNSYEMAYMWLVKFFHKTDGEAHDLARKALTAIQSARNLIPLYDEDGTLAGRSFRALDPSIRQVERGAWQLTLRWRSPRYYAEDPATLASALHFIVNGRKEVQT